MARILFLPNYLGGGFGHIGRCMALAESWQRRGGEAAMIVGGRQAARVREAGIPVVVPRSTPASRGESQAPAYTFIPDMAYQVVRDGFDHPAHVWRVLRELEQIARQVQPDILVGDGFLLTGMLGRKLGLPTAQIVKSVAHPLFRTNIAPWEPTPPGLVVPDIRPVFNPVLRWLRQPEVEHSAQLLRGDLYWMAGGLPCLDPLDPLPENTTWPGPLMRPAGAEEAAPWLDGLPANRPVVYVTIGGATLRGSWAAQSKLIMEALGGRNLTVVFSTGGLENLLQSNAPDNFMVRSWVPTRKMLRRSDAVIFHGGYTRLQILGEGLPSVVLPGHSEQEYYGRIMEQLGVSRVLALSDEPYVCHPAAWRGGRWFGRRGFTIHTRQAVTLSAGRLRQAVEEALEDSEMRQRANRIKAALDEQGGCETALDRIATLGK